MATQISDADERSRTSAIIDGKTGSEGQAVQNPAQLVSKNDENPDPAGAGESFDPGTGGDHLRQAGQAVDPAAVGNPHPPIERDHTPAESPRKDSHKSQNSSGPELDRLAAILRAIPAEHRAEFLRGLADRIEGKPQ